MKLTLLGSTGFVGKVLLARAIESNHEVRTLVRTPEKLGEWRKRVSYVVGDATDGAAVASALGGSDAVLSTIGPPARNPGDPRRYEVAMKNIVHAMEELGLKRIIHTGGAGYAVLEDEHWPLRRRFLRAFLRFFGAKPILEAKRLEWQVLKNSTLDWTLVRPPAITTSAPSGKLVADERRLHAISMNVFDLVEFMLEQALSREWIHKAPLLSSLRVSKQLS